MGDNADAFPNDANETLDSDLDGVGNNADVFPNDPDETVDSDGDGVGDNGDWAPNDASKPLTMTRRRGRQRRRLPEDRSNPPTPTWTAWATTLTCSPRRHANHRR